MDETQKSINTVICQFEPPHRQHLRRKWQSLETRLKPNGILTEKKNMNQFCWIGQKKVYCAVVRK